MYEEIKAQSKKAAEELISVAGLKKGNLVVVGCSSSEVCGSKIGTASAPETAKAIFEGLYTVFLENGIYMAAQCCEHLNRALILEREAAEKRGYEIVCVVPKPKAGGSFATTAYQNFKDPVAVEEIKADAGLDIGLTLIGMHLKHVAVPLRLSVDSIGQAHITAARTRPKYIGGERACYE